ncbi:alanine--tRNA ligase-related protein [Paenibacillus oleatilyticus]|uniref:alanine--tRNA ligase n=1 Tax=Paenibacillus oleatilyticus TaxID=2594886 RepID=A0ABV4V1K7_9BACL
MKALEIRDRYAEFFYQRGYEKLLEHSILNNNQSTVFFNGSALTPNLDIFLSNNLRSSNFSFTQQRVFHSKPMDEIPHLPLFSIFQVMMSFYQFEQPNLKNAFQIGMQILTEILGLSRHDLYLLVPRNQPELIEMSKYLGVDHNNFVFWNQAPVFRAGDTLQGFYLKLFLKYKHGFIPIWDLVQINQADPTVIHVDNCLFLERVTFILQQKDTWFHTELFESLVKFIEAREGIHVFNSLYGYWLVHMARSLICALADGASIGNKGPGYVIRKIIRKILKERDRYKLSITLASLVKPSLECLCRVGYNWGHEQARIEESLDIEESTYKKTYILAERFLQKQVETFALGKRKPFHWDELLEWRNTRGISEDVSYEFISAHGHTIHGYVSPNFEMRKLYYTDGYQYPQNHSIHNIHSFLNKIEAQRKLER